MVGRAAWNNPCIFSEFLDRPLPGKRAVLERYFDLCEQYGASDLTDLKAQVCGLLSGMPYAKQVRTRLMHAKTLYEARVITLEGIEAPALSPACACTGINA